jgi:hypothetical protein
MDGVGCGVWGVGRGARGGGQPAVYQGLPERLGRYLVELDQVGGIAVEVHNGEEAVLMGGQDGLLLRQVGGADREDRAGRRPLVAEPLDVRLAERALPGERLAADFPGPEATVLLLAFRHLGEPGRDPGHIIEGLHELNGTRATSAGELEARDRSK